MTSASEPDSFLQSASYNALGQVVAETKGNGVSSAYTYNPQRGFLTRILTTSGATTLQDLTYARSASGMINSITSPDLGRSWIYSYDGLDRLITADNQNGTGDRSSLIIII